MASPVCTPEPARNPETREPRQRRRPEHLAKRPFRFTPCQVGKAHRLPFPPSSHRAPTRLFRCYGDLLDVGTPSIGGARYFLILGDDHTRKLWGFPLGRKSDAFDAIRGWLLQVQTFTGLKVKQFGTDGGGEFLNKDVDALLRENGTERFVTPAYTSQRNSRSERPNLTTVEAIITLLAESGLPDKFWEEITLAHLVTKNLSLHAGIGGSVLDALWDPSRCPSVAHLRPNGCKGTMMLRPHYHAGHHGTNLQAQASSPQYCTPGLGATEPTRAALLRALYAHSCLSPPPLTYAHIPFLSSLSRFSELTLLC
mgnify:CR=1 FL=1